MQCLLQQTFSDLLVWIFTLLTKWTYRECRTGKEFAQVGAICQSWNIISQKHIRTTSHLQHRFQLIWFMVRLSRNDSLQIEIRCRLLSSLLSFNTFQGNLIPLLVHLLVLFIKLMHNICKIFQTLPRNEC